MDAEPDDLEAELAQSLQDLQGKPINTQPHPPIQSLTDKYHAVEEYHRHLRGQVANERMGLEQEFRRRMLQIGQDHETRVSNLIAQAEAERLEKLRDLKATFDEKKRELDLLAQKMG